MAAQDAPNSIVRATNTVRVVKGTKDPSKKWGFQNFGLQTGDGMFVQFEQVFDAGEGSHFLPPGDYEVQPSSAYIDRAGRLQIGREFVLVKPAAASPASK